MPDRTFRTEHRRLRGLLRREGLDPYEPAQPFVSVGERYRLRRKPRVGDPATLMARLLEDSLRVWSFGAIVGIDA